MCLGLLSIRDDGLYVLTRVGALIYYLLRHVLLDLAVEALREGEWSHDPGFGVVL